MPWSHRKRFLTAIEFKEPDMVPVADNIDPLIVEKIIGRKTPRRTAYRKGEDTFEVDLQSVMNYVEACKRLDFDAVRVYADSLPYRGYVPKFLDEATFVDEWGMVCKLSPITTWWVDGIIKTPEDLDSYVPPDPAAPGRMEIIEKVVREVGKDMVVIGGGHTGFSISWRIRGGMDKLFFDMYANPSFAKRLMGIVADVCVELDKAVMDAGVDILDITDDYADAHGPLIHPKLFREFELQHLKRVANAARKRGIPLLKHTDGDASLLMEDMIDAGISGLEPIEYSAMDIGEVKEKFGDKIFIMGNVDARYVLPYGSEEDVRRDVRRCIDAAAKGGGYILSSSHGIGSGAYVKVENVLAMIDEARKYGKYKG